MGAGDVVFRFYRPEDRDTVKGFRRSDRGRPWTREAQDVIREPPDLLSDPDLAFEIVVGTDPSGRIVGVIVFGADTDHADRRTIFSMGVVRDRRRQGIGITMKKATLVEIAAAGYDGVVFSQVHKYNKAMLGLNEKLGVKRDMDPDRPRYFLSATAGEPSEDPVASPET